MNSAQALGLVQCRTCGSLTRIADTSLQANAHLVGSCEVCGERIESFSMRSLQRVWAFWLAGIVAYLPGNLLPIMSTRTPGGNSPSTILGGVVTLIEHGSYLIAAVIFFASIVVPVSKFLVLAWITLSIQRAHVQGARARHQAHELVELIGSWSMVDVFVVAALAALIQLGAIMSVVPGPGIEFFALSVLLTMLAARSLDTRLIWLSGDKTP
ncbi:MAG: paraquat-inducible protein A [Pseudomonadota bacterium]